jgi:hypothetical protein
VGGLLDQLGAVVAPSELPRLVASLRSVSHGLPGLETGLVKLAPSLDEVMRCISTHVVPVLDEKLNDGSLSTGEPAWLDLLHAGTGLSGLSSDFDANGVAVRAGVTVGDQTLTGTSQELGQLVASAAQAIEGVDPEWLGPGVSPPMRPDAPCVDQALPDLGARRVAGTAGLEDSVR